MSKGNEDRAEWANPKNMILALLFLAGGGTGGWAGSSSQLSEIDKRLVEIRAAIEAVEKSQGDNDEDIKDLQRRIRLLELEAARKVDR